MGYFPFGHEFSPSLIKEIKCKLVWLLTGTGSSSHAIQLSSAADRSADELTSLHSLSQFDAEKLKQLISVTEHLESNVIAIRCHTIAGADACTELGDDEYCIAIAGTHLIVTCLRLLILLRP